MGCAKTAFSVGSEGRARGDHDHRTTFDPREDSYRTQDVDRNGKLRANDTRVHGHPPNFKMYCFFVSVSCSDVSVHKPVHV
jgi:hypothetical protein